MLRRDGSDVPFRMNVTSCRIYDSDFRNTGAYIPAPGDRLILVYAAGEPQYAYVALRDKTGGQ